MFIQMQPDATAEDIDRVTEEIRRVGWDYIINPGEELTCIAVKSRTTGPEKMEFVERIQAYRGVARAIPITTPYKLPARTVGQTTTLVSIDNKVVVGGECFTIIAGPCAIETREQLFETTEAVKSAGAVCLRGGAFKPRKDCGSFRGLGIDGLVYLKEAREKFDLPTFTEIVDAKDIDAVADHASVFQIGMRNARNYTLLEAVAETKKPVLYKNGEAMTVEDFLCGAEYILSKGNPNLILCLRGTVTFDRAVRNSLDIGIVAALRQLTHLPIIVDPSHSTGKADLVTPVAVAAATIADGIIVDVHTDPTKALCDGPQALTPPRFAELVRQVQRVVNAVHHA